MSVKLSVQAMTELLIDARIEQICHLQGKVRTIP